MNSIGSMDFTDLRMDSTDLLDLGLLDSNGCADNNAPFATGVFEDYFTGDQLNASAVVKEEPEDMAAGFNDVLGRDVLEQPSDIMASDDDYEADVCLGNLLSSPNAESSRESALPVVTTGEYMTTRKAAAKVKQEPKKSKRSRRVRTPKQQELNRLAQQRYRERKKQKYTNLQQAVDALSVQLERVAVVEEERNVLQAEKEELEVVVKQQTTKIMARDNIIKQQQKQIEAQQAEIAALKQRLSALPAPLNNVEMSQLLRTAITSAVSKVLEEQDCKSAQMLVPLSEVVLEKLTTSVFQHCNCRELTTDASATKPLPQVVQVSCC